MFLEIDCTRFGPKVASTSKSLCRSLTIFQYLSEFNVEPNTLRYQVEDDALEIANFFSKESLTCAIFFRMELINLRAQTTANISKYFRLALRYALTQIFSETSATSVVLYGADELCNVVRSYQKLFPSLRDAQIKQHEVYTQLTAPKVFTFFFPTTPEELFPLPTCENGNIGIDIGSASVKWNGKTSAGRVVSGYRRIRSWKDVCQVQEDLLKEDTQLTFFYTGVNRMLQEAEYAVNEISAQQQCAQMALPKNTSMILDLGAQDFKCIPLSSTTPTQVNTKCLASFGMFITTLLQHFNLSWVELQHILADAQKKSQIELVELSGSCSEYALREITNYTQLLSKEQLVLSALYWRCSKLPTVLYNKKEVAVTGKLCQIKEFRQFLSAFFRWSTLYSYTQPALSGATGAIFTAQKHKTTLQKLQQYKRLPKYRLYVISETATEISFASSVGPYAVPIDVLPKISNVKRVIDIDEADVENADASLACQPVIFLRNIVRNLKKTTSKELKYLAYISVHNDKVFSNCSLLASETALEIVIGVTTCKFITVESGFQNPCTSSNLQRVLGTDIEFCISQLPIFQESSCRFCSRVVADNTTAPVIDVQQKSCIGKAYIEDLQLTQNM